MAREGRRPISRSHVMDCQGTQRSR
jgi:hypothetical protein